MNLKPIITNTSDFPTQIQPFVTGVKLFDSSCSPEAQVLFADKEQGFFIKSSVKGALEREADLTRWFHGKGLSAAVIAYVSDEKDWLVTEKVPGDDCIAAKYLEQPERLCDTLAERLALLHSTDFAGCPVQNRTAQYIAKAKQNYHAGICDASLFPDNWGYTSAEEAFSVIGKSSSLLKTDTLLHGDYCLPNIILDNWNFSGFIDVDGGGVGDRHVDLFWGIWTLFFNLKTNQYRQRFIDCYGRDKVDEEYLRIVAACEVFG
ncbi:MAG: aminoglycoside 3'-phosphotransferase [Oscillospiraceae bacterium]|jgi:kanamycin kinase|nr:aminoglycoside 3'-phosphotransferase [Oscillospiraceae bacterium]